MMDPELRDIIVPELAEGEELLWVDKKNTVPDETPLFRKVLPWIVAGFGIAICVFGAVTNWIEKQYFETAGWVFILLCGIFISQDMFKSESDNRDYVYGVTDQRLIAINSDNEVQSFVGKAFNSLYRHRQNQYQTLVLQGGFYNRNDMVELEIKNIQTADEVIPLLLANFVENPPPEEHED